MPSDNKRLLIELHKRIREINRDVINPQFAELKLQDFEPVMRLAARARGDYLKALVEAAAKAGDAMPTPDQVKHLRYLRLSYEELVEGAHALEIAIERGYLDVRGEG